MTRELAKNILAEHIKLMERENEPLLKEDIDALILAIQALSQEPTVQDKQAESEKYQKAFDDGYANGYAQARFDYEQEPCDDAVSQKENSL